MNHSQFTKQFIEMEESNNLFSYRLKDRVVWDYLRYAAYRNILDVAIRQDQISFNKSWRHKSRKVATEAFSLLRHVLVSCYRYFWSGPYDILIVGYDRRNYIDNRLVNISFYPLIKSMVENYRILYLDPTVLSVAVEDDYPCDVFRKRVLTPLTRFQCFSRPLKLHEKETLDRIVSVLTTSFEVAPETFSWFEDYFLRQYRESKIYSRLFRRFRPKIIFHADDSTAKGWIEMAGALKIPVVDFQHSQMSRDNILYTYSQTHRPRRLPTLSDAIFTFAEYWNGLYSLPVPRISVGFPYLEAKTKELKSSGPRGLNTFLVISSMHSGKTLELLVLDLARKLPSSTIIYKLRSEEYGRWRETRSPAFGSTNNIHVVDNDTVPLYELFRQSTYQIGINSTALIEGMAFDLKTFIVKHGYYFEMSDLIQRGFVTLVESADDILAALQAPHLISSPPPAASLFKSDSLQNVAREVRNIVASAHQCKKDGLP